MLLKFIKEINFHADDVAGRHFTYLTLSSSLRSMALTSHFGCVVCALFGDRAVICFVAICDQITNDYEASMSHSNMNIKDKDIYLSSTEKKIINTVGMYISGF